MHEGAEKARSSVYWGGVFLAESSKHVVPWHLIPTSTLNVSILLQFCEEENWILNKSNYWARVIALFSS